MRIFDAIEELLSRKSSVQMVADDPQMSAEIMLLIRTMFADGEMSAEEVQTFKEICKAVFNIPHDDVADVINHLREFSYETSYEQAAALFAEMPEDRKARLLSHLMMMAMADARFVEGERAMILRVGRVLGFDEGKMEKLL